MLQYQVFSMHEEWYGPQRQRYTIVGSVRDTALHRTARQAGYEDEHSMGYNTLEAPHRSKPTVQHTAYLHSHPFRNPPGSGSAASPPSSFPIDSCEDDPPLLVSTNFTSSHSRFSVHPLLPSRATSLCAFSQRPWRSGIVPADIAKACCPAYQPCFLMDNAIPGTWDSKCRSLLHHRITQQRMARRRYHALAIL